MKHFIATSDWAGKKRILCLFLLVTAVCMSVAAQSNDFIDKLLDEKAAAYGDTALIALASAGLVPPDATVEQAIKFLGDNKWGFVRKPEELATLGDISYLLMRAFKMGGGIMYAIFPGPRYACRQFEYLELVQKNPIPSRLVSGEEVMQLITEVLAYREEAVQ
jgi:hypothetical protein